MIWRIMQNSDEGVIHLIAACGDAVKRKPNPMFANYESAISEGVYKLKDILFPTMCYFFMFLTYVCELLPFWAKMAKKKQMC